MFASNKFFGFPPLIPFGTEIATPKSEKNVVEKVLEGIERNVTGEDERSKNGFILSRQAGIKIRFNPPVFDNVAHFFRSEEAKSLQIPPQKQCFPEGCFRLHTFQIVNFQKPETFTLKPLGPNLLLLNIANFDLNIESLLSGNIQFLLFTPMPVSGNFYVDAQELSIKALLGLQKDGKKVPSLRMVNCELIDGIINTKDDILSKAKALITTTICNTIFKTIRERVNLSLSKLPQFLSVSDILVTLFENFNGTEECVKNGCNLTATPTTTTYSDYNLNKMLDFLDLNALKHVLINLEFLDSTAGVDYFSVGLMGDVFIAKNGSDEQNINKLDNNNSLQTSINTDNDLLFVSENVDNSVLEINNLFDDNLQNITSISMNFNDFEWRREGSIEIVFTQQTANNLLLKAFRANLLSIYVGQNSPLFGPLLRTSCDLDNICLGDTIPEASEIYPNEQLELKILPTEAPILNVTEDLATLSLSGVGIFFLARDPFGQQIAQIPFFTIIELNIGMENVPIATLQGGFRDSIRNAIINFAKKFLNMSSGSDKLKQQQQKMPPKKDVQNEAKTDSDSVGSVLWYLKDIKQDVTTIKTDVKTNSETLAAHSVSISALEKGLEDLKKEQKSDNEKLRKEQKEYNENLLKKIGKRFDGVDLEHKKLAEKVNEISTDQKVLTANFANLEKTVSNLKDVVSSNSEKLSSNSAKLSDLQHDVSTQKTAIDGIGDTLKTTNTKVETLCVDIAVIKEVSFISMVNIQAFIASVQNLTGDGTSNELVHFCRKWFDENNDKLNFVEADRLLNQLVASQTTTSFTLAIVCCLFCKVTKVKTENELKDFLIGFDEVTSTDNSNSANPPPQQSQQPSSTAPTNSSSLTSTAVSFLQKAVNTVSGTFGNPKSDVPCNKPTLQTIVLFNRRSILLYFYYGALIYGALEKWEDSCLFLEYLITLPSKRCSSIILEGLKKYLIISLIIGRKKPLELLPSYRTPSLNRNYYHYALVYIRLPHLIEKALEAKKDLVVVLENFLNDKIAVFSKDQNVGLMKVLINVSRENALKRLENIFVSLQLNDVCRLAHLPSNINNDDEAMNEIIELSKVIRSFNDVIRLNPNFIEKGIQRSKSVGGGGCSTSMTVGGGGGNNGGGGASNLRNDGIFGGIISGIF
uniref:Lipid-binding serum glycoprotein C-terminal domain-containing protein n=1 Tax=Meloidogyne javanica TaxID=6303 RepID=A0A915N8I9_MELJA